MATDHLDTILGHHVWATLALLDRCAALTPDQLRLTVPGTYGSIHATLAHLVAADRRYLVGITGGERVAWSPDDPPPLAVIDRRRLPGGVAGRGVPRARVTRELGSPVGRGGIRARFR